MTQDLTSMRPMRTHASRNRLRYANLNMWLNNYLNFSLFLAQMNFYDTLMVLFI